MIHIFCPTFNETVGNFELHEISYNQMREILCTAYERVPADLGDDPYDQSLSLDDVDSDTQLQQVIWRHSWRAVKCMLRKYAKLRLSANIDSRKHGAAGMQHRTKVGDQALVFKPIANADLRSRDLRPTDFDYIHIIRTK